MTMEAVDAHQSVRKNDRPRNQGGFEAVDDRFDEQDLKFVGLGQKLDKIIGMIKAMRNGKPRSNGTDQA